MLTVRQYPEDRHPLAMIASLILIIVFALTWGYVSLGSDAIDTHNLRWISHDLATAYGSWAFYLADERAGWLTTDRPSFPIPISVAWFDSMPLFLLAAQLIPRGLVEGQQFFGVYFMVGLVLQGISGYFAMLRSLELVSIPNTIARNHIAFIGGIFFVLVPYTVMRFQAHAALSSQWILVMSILATLSTLRSSRLVWLGFNGLIVFVAAGINLYLLLMIFISNVFVLASERNMIDIQEIGYRTIVLGGIALFGVWTFGYIFGPHAATVGYGYYSMNMLGPIDSNGRGGLLGLDIVDPTGGQTFEGFAYLGLGVLLMLAATPFCFLHVQGNLPRSNNFPIATIVWMAIFFYAISLSNVVTLSGLTFQIPIPEFLMALTNAFRSSGRFFWMAGFWLVLVAGVAIALRMGSRRAAVFMSVLCLIQLIDVYPIAASVRASISRSSGLEMKEIDASKASSLLVYPPRQCDLDATPGGDRNFEFINKIALQNNIPTNNFYAARLPMDQLHYHCETSGQLVQIDVNAIYFLSQGIYAQHQEKFSSGFLCSLRSLEGEIANPFWVCTPRR